MVSLATKFINGALIILLLNMANARSWFNETGLVNEISSIVLAAAVTEPIFLIINTPFLYT